MTTYDNGGVKRLTRSSSTKMLAGVCGGLAEYTGWDIARVGLAVRLKATSRDGNRRG